MKRNFFAFFLGLAIILVWSCGNNGSTKKLQNAENMVIQQDDGIISLNLDKAARYCDDVNPSGNTAEWKFVINKPGRFKIWI